MIQISTGVTNKSNGKLGGTIVAICFMVLGAAVIVLPPGNNTLNEAETDYPEKGLPWGLLGTYCITFAGVWLINYRKSNMLQSAADTVMDEHSATTWADYIVKLLRGISDSIREPSKRKISTLQQAAFLNAAASLWKSQISAQEGQLGRLTERFYSRFPEAPGLFRGIMMSQFNSTSRALDSQRRELSSLLQAAQQEGIGHSSWNDLRHAMTSLIAEHMPAFVGKLEAALLMSFNGSDVLANANSYEVGEKAGASLVD